MRNNSGRSVLFRGAGATLYSNRHLLLALTIREVRDRYAGSLLGLMWAILQPMAFITILIVVFDFAFSAKLGRDSVAHGSDYAALVIAGYLPWMAIGGGIQAAIGSIRANAGLVKQIDFPLAVLPAKVVLAQLTGQLIGICLLLVYLALSRHALPLTLILVPAVLLFQLLLMIGLGFFLATFGVYFRDLEHALPTFLMINLYLLPIFYPPGAAPQSIQTLIAWNPFSPFVLLFQDLLIHERVGTLETWSTVVLLSLGSLALGYRLFRRASVGFGDLV